MDNHPNEIHNTVIGSALSFSFNAFFAHILQWFKALLVMLLWLLPFIVAIFLCGGIITSLDVRHVFDQVLILIPGWVNSIGITKLEYIDCSFNKIRDSLCFRC